MITKTTIDWLRFRVQASPGEVLEALRPLYGGVGSILNLGAPTRGMLGFQHGLPLMLGKNVVLGRIDLGGDSQRGWARIDITGTGCSWAQDWDALDLVEKLPASELRRCDLALTTWAGEIRHEQIVDAHQRGRFNCGGRTPNLRTIDNSDKSEGRTCYVGKRAGDKFLRAYEKGYEIAKKTGLSGVTHIDGHKVEDIFRVEVENKAHDTILPWEVIERRDQYFAGAYPFCADILPGVEADILQRRPDRAAERDLAAALAHCQNQWGATLFTALHAYHGDIGAVWDKVVGTKHNEALLEAGVLLDQE